MLVEIASAVIIAQLVEMRSKVSSLGKRVHAIEHKCAEHHKRVMLPAFGLLMALCMAPVLSACYSPRLPDIPATPAVPALIPSVPVSSAGTATAAPQGRAAIVERATGLWGAWGIGVSILGLLACLAGRIWVAPLAPVWNRVALFAGCMLAVAITAWTLAPAMYWIFVGTSVLTVATVLGAGFVYLRRYVLAHHDPDHPSGAKVITATYKKA